MDLSKKNIVCLFAEQEWPTLESALPTDNNSSVGNKHTEDKKVNSKGRFCFSCGSNTHFRGNPECPQFSIVKKMKSTTTPNKESDTSNKKENSTPRPKAAWKYVHPADEKQTITDQSKKY